MKKYLFVSCLAVVVLLAGCKETPKEEWNIGREYTYNCFYIAFVDESGTSLLDQVKLVESDRYSYLMIGWSEYTKRCFDNGLEAFRDEYGREPIYVYPEFECLGFLCDWWYDKDKPWEAFHAFPGKDHVFEIIFSCPAIYGDDQEHRFVFEKSKPLLGFEHCADRVLYDGEVIATDVRWRDIPLKIVVKRGQE